MTNRLNVLNLLIRLGGLETGVRVATFAASILVARGLPPPTFARFVFLWSLVQSLWVIVEIGTTTYGMREVSKRPESLETLYSEIVAVRLFHSACVLVPVLALMFLTPWSPSERLYATLLLLYLPFYALYPDWAARGAENVPLLTMGRSVYGGACLAIATCVFLGGVPSLAHAMYPLSAAAASLSMIVFARRRSIKLAPRLALTNYSRHVRSAWIYAVGGVLMATIHFLPLLWMEYRAGASGLESFAPAYRFVMLLAGLGSVASLVLVPRFTTYIVRSDKLLITSVRWFSFASIGIGGLLSLILGFAGGQILLLVYGAKYLAAATTVSGLAPLVTLCALQYVMGAVVTASGRQDKYCIALVAGILVQVGVFAFAGSVDASPVSSAVVASVAGLGVLVIGLTWSAMTTISQLASA